MSPQPTVSSYAIPGPLALRSWSGYDLTRHATSYLDRGHPLPDRTHPSVLFATFQVEVFRLMQRWADFASDEIDHRPDINGVGRTDRVDELIVAMRDRRSVLAGEAPREPADPTSP